MRHKYETRAIILSRSAAGESGARLALVTPELGLLRAHAQGVRKSGARLASALTTLAESDVVLVRGKETWRVTGAVLAEPWAPRLAPVERERVMRVIELILRLAAEGAHDATGLFSILHDCLQGLATQPDELHEAIEILAVLRILAALGLDTGGAPGARAATPEALQDILRERTSYIARINHGIEASGL